MKKRVGTEGMPKRKGKERIKKRNGVKEAKGIEGRMLPGVNRDGRGRAGWLNRRKNKPFLQKYWLETLILLSSAALVSFGAFVFYQEFFDSGTPPSGEEQNTGNHSPANNTTSPPPAECTHRVGTGPEDFTINYGTEYGGSKAGAPVNHSSWVLSAVASAPVVILAHSESCAPCVVMAGTMNSIVQNYGSYINYIDLLTDSEDPAIQSRVQDVYNVYYDPQYPYSIPLTVIITKTKVNNEVMIVWQSFVGSRDYSTVENWVRAAICQYQKITGSRGDSDGVDVDMDIDMDMGVADTDKAELCTNGSRASPVITQAGHLPEAPTTEDNLTVWAVVEPQGLPWVKVKFCGQICTIPQSMAYNGSAYTFTTPCNIFSPGTVEYHIEAKDESGNWAFWNGTVNILNSTEPHSNDNDTTGKTTGDNHSSGLGGGVLGGLLLSSAGITAYIYTWKKRRRSG